MKKKLDETTIANELRGASAFFTNTKPTDTTTPPIDRTDDRSVKRTVDRSEDKHGEGVGVASTAEDVATGSLIQEVRQGGLPVTRPTERYAFEIYTDQKRQLNRIRYLYQEKTGQQLAASRIIREAIGPYLDALEEELTKP